jgi:putative aldouronate transport system permease protein
MMANNSIAPGKLSLNERFEKRITLYSKYKLLYLMLLPGLVALIIFMYIPMYGVIIAFKDFKLTQGIFESHWVGFQNFKYLFVRDEIWIAIRNSVTISLYNLAVSFPSVIIFSLLLNELRNGAFKKTVQTISYLPHFLSWVVIARVVIEFLSPTRGPLNQFITAMGMDPIHFIVEPRCFKTILVLSSIWKGIGWSSVIYLAVISNADPMLYDAATVDGAGRFRLMWHITLPTMYPVITIVLIFSISGLLGGDFEQIYNLKTSQTHEVGNVISTFVYSMGLEKFNYSLSTAIGLMNNIVAMILLIIANAIARRFSECSLW